MKQTVLQCERISVGYGPEAVLRDIDFTLTAGEFLPLIGPNGSGKTTFLRALLGLVPVRSGAIKLMHQEKSPGYVPQQKQIDPLYPVSVKAIIAMGLYPELGCWRRPDRNQRRRLDSTLEKFGLSRHQTKTFGELSGGMRQKCLLARAFVTGATIFFLDEPTAGLDAASERWFLNHLVDLNREEGKTILMAHHRLEDLSFLSQHVCLVDHKQVRRIPAHQTWQHIQAHPEGDDA